MIAGFRSMLGRWLGGLSSPPSVPDEPGCLDVYDSQLGTVTLFSNAAGSVTLFDSACD